MFFKSKKQAKNETDKSLQVNVDLEIVTKMNQEFAVSLDLNDTLKTALQVIIARINAEAANIFLINDKKKKFECIASLHQNYLDEYELDLKDNYFSVRGELVFVNTQKKEIVIKVRSASKLKNFKNKNFKLIIKGELSLELLNSFVSLDINREGNALKLIRYEVIEKDLSENK